MIVNMNRENDILFNNTHSSQQMDKSDHNKKKAAKSGSIYSGNLNLFQDDITMKKVMAHKKELKTVLDTYANDARINDNIESRRQRIEKLQDEYKEYTKELDNIEDKKQQLKEKYGISDNPEESAASPELLSEYEMLVSEYDKMTEEFQKKLNDSRYLMTEESKVINDIALERLKTDPMVAAGKKADAILEEAGQEIIDMVFDDTKEKIDKDMKEQKEKAKEKAKEEEEEW